MKIRILNGHLLSYVQKKGSWDEANPDSNSFEIEIGTAPIKGHYIIYTTVDSSDTFIGLIDEVVYVGTNVYVFISSSTLAA